MPSSKTIANKLLVFAIVGGASLVGWRMVGPANLDPAGTEHLVNRLWIDRMPETHRDMVARLAVIRTPDVRVGIVGRGSVWRHFFDVFKWAQEGDRLLTVFPQENVRAQFQVRTWSCEHEAPEPFELCLEVRRGDRTAKLYSREDWVIEPKDIDRDLAAIADAWPTLGKLPAFDPASLSAVGDESGIGEAVEDWFPAGL